MTRIGPPLLLFSLAACEGVIVGAGRDTPPTPPRPVEACAAVAERAWLPARVRRLQANEYRNTLASLTSSTPALEFPADPAPNGYGTRADALRVNAPLVELLWREMPALAGTTARQLLTSPPCRPADGEACAKTLLSAFGARAYRRPLSDDEVGDLLEVFSVGATGADFATGLALALEVVFQSSSMLFHTELGAGGLTPYETAELLAYQLTGAPPDAELTALASRGAIDGATREAQARRLVATPAARAVLGDFAAQWLRVDRVAASEKQRFPQWSALRTSALEETRSFVATAMLDGEPLRTLFTADWTTTTDASLAAHYGATSLSASRWKLPSARAGVLSQASVMATFALGSESAPVQRGRLVRTRLLCQFKRFAPPTDLKITLPPLDPNATTRERFAAHSSNPTCQGCHRFLDPIGFGFEHFDAIGGYRELENGRPVDATGQLTETDADGTFDGVRGLGALLASSAAARDCFAQNWFEYAMGQPLDEVGLPALCSLRDATHSFTSSEEAMTAALFEIIRSDLFTARTP